MKSSPAKSFVQKVTGLFAAAQKKLAGLWH
jgi:hypothetical protein